MIVKMLHLDLVCLAKEKDNTLTQLRDLGAVHLDLSSAQGATVAAAKGAAAMPRRRFASFSRPAARRRT